MKGSPVRVRASASSETPCKSAGLEGALRGSAGSPNLASGYSRGTPESRTALLPGGWSQAGALVEGTCSPRRGMRAAGSPGVDRAWLCAVQARLSSAGSRGPRSLAAGSCQSTPSIARDRSLARRDARLDCRWPAVHQVESARRRERPGSMCSLGAPAGGHGGRYRTRIIDTALAFPTRCFFLPTWSALIYGYQKPARGVALVAYERMFETGAQNGYGDQSALSTLALPIGPHRVPPPRSCRRTAPSSGHGRAHRPANPRMALYLRAVRCAGAQVPLIRTIWRGRCRGRRSTLRSAQAPTQRRGRTDEGCRGRLRAAGAGQDDCCGGPHRQNRPELSNTDAAGPGVHARLTIEAPCSLAWLPCHTTTRSSIQRHPSAAWISASTRSTEPTRSARSAHSSNATSRPARRRSTRCCSTRPRAYRSAKVRDILLALPKIGKVKATTILERCRVSHSNTFGGLTDRQRAELAARLSQ